MKSILRFLAFAILAVPGALPAQLRLPAIFGEHMVLQQKQANPIWGWDTPGTKVVVTLAGTPHATLAGPDGKWSVRLQPMPASNTPVALSVAGSSRIELRDVLVGEVWMCAGQSNMTFHMVEAYAGDLEGAASHFPNLRSITVPQVGTQELQDDFQGAWKAATPENVRGFSAVGFMFARYLHQILGVPVGIVTNAWGGSAAEAWFRRTTLEADPRFRPLVEENIARETLSNSPAGQAMYEAALADWKRRCDKAREAGEREPPRPLEWLKDNKRAGNIFAGVVHPTLGYGIKGVIWYQGESNASRAAEYNELFPFLIEQWRKEWGQGDFPFYWVQLADFQPEQPQPGESSWAELREAQTRTLRLPNTGQAVIIDTGEGRNIHPRNKHDVAARLVRWALAKDYGLNLPYRSPEFQRVEFSGGQALVTFDCFGDKLYSFDVPEVVGFAVCGADKVWHWAKGEIRGRDQVKVWSEDVPAPIAVRYAWADNPRCNLYSRTGLPATPFRTDDFELSTKRKPQTPN